VIVVGVVFDGSDAGKHHAQGLKNCTFIGREDFFRAMVMMQCSISLQ